MRDYLVNQGYLVDLSPLYDYSAKKVKFKPDNFTDATMKSYVQSLEEGFLFNQRKLNKACQRIVATSLHGPAIDYLRKLFANFGFPSILVPECQQASTCQFETVVSPDPVLGKLSLRHALNMAEAKEAKFVICTDPIGQSLTIAEYLPNEKSWYIYKSYEISILLLDYLLSNAVKD